jgi:hypothetical protein
MKRLNAHLGRTTDMLSAFFVLLAVMLAGGYGPATAQVGPAPATSQSSPTDLGSGSHRPVPFVSKQQLLAGEARDLKATSWDDGKPKAFLTAQGLDLANIATGTDYARPTAASVASIAAAPYEARAPPARS